MPLLTDGQYRIFNAQFVAQDVDLLFAWSTGIIGGYVNNSYSYNMVWNLKNVGDGLNQFTLTSAATQNEVYAFVDDANIGTTLHGSSNPAAWTIIPTPNLGHYWIIAPRAVNSTIPSGLVWSLPNGDNLTPLKLAQIAPNDSSQMWTFESHTVTVGNTNNVEDGDLD